MECYRVTSCQTPHQGPDSRETPRKGLRPPVCMVRTSQALDRNALHQAACLYLPICSGRAQGCPLGLEDDRYLSAGLPSTAAGPDSPIVMTQKSWTESERQSLPAQAEQPGAQLIRQTCGISQAAATAPATAAGIQGLSCRPLGWPKGATVTTSTSCSPLIPAPGSCPCVPETAHSTRSMSLRLPCEISILAL